MKQSIPQERRGFLYSLRRYSPARWVSRKWEAYDTRRMQKKYPEELSEHGEVLKNALRRQRSTAEEIIKFRRGYQNLSPKGRRLFLNAFQKTHQEKWKENAKTLGIREDLELENPWTHMRRILNRRPVVTETRD